MVLDEETGHLVCTHHEVTPGGSLVSCGHRLRDTHLIRMLLSANAIAHKGKEIPPAFAVAPTEQSKTRQEPARTLGSLSLYVNPHFARYRFATTGAGKKRRSVR